MKLKINDENLSALVICLSIGTLQAIRAGVIPAEYGIWSLGAPKFWQPLTQTGLIADNIIEVLQTTDELDALQQLKPEKFEENITTLIDRLFIELTKCPNPMWEGNWEAET